LAQSFYCADDVIFCGPGISSGLISSGLAPSLPSLCPKKKLIDFLFYVKIQRDD
jgi:hypothetical protein